MFEYILEILHCGIILVFGIFLSASFLGIRMNRGNIMVLSGFSLILGTMNILSYVLFGAGFTEKIYPLMIHLPLILFLHFFYQYHTNSSILSVFIAYLCCQISNWCGLFFLQVTKQQWVYYSVRIVINIIVLLVLIRFVSMAVAEILQKPAKDILIFGLIPMVYYVYDYVVTVYTALAYSGREVIVEFLGFMLCIFYLLFLFLYFKQYEEKMEAEHRNHLMEMQRLQSEKEVERMKRSEYEIAILRHDMRHFLNDIAGFIEHGENEKAQGYIQEIIATTDKTIRKEYCVNKIVNMILSSYENTMIEYGITFRYLVRIPKNLAYTDCDISSILSNGLENAVHAVSLLEKEQREIELDMHMNSDKLLISIKNTYAKKPDLIDGLPQTKERGHGFGTQSIRYITEKLRGNCQFALEGRCFVLRIVLPSAHAEDGDSDRKTSIS